MNEKLQNITTAISPDNLTGEWSIWQRTSNGTSTKIEGDLPEEIARQMVADYAAEGETVWMERTAAE